MRLRLLFTTASCLAIAGCGDDSSASDDAGTTSDTGVQTSADAGSGLDADSSTSGDGGTFVSSCTGSGAAKAVCAANELLTVLPSATKSAVNLQYSDFASRTMWSNLPGVTRAGVKIGTMDANSKAAALSLMATVLSSDGDTDLIGILNADDYLGSLSGSGGGGAAGDGGTQSGGGPGGGGPGGDGGMPFGGTGGPGGGASDAGTTTGTGTGSAYSSANYSVAIFGTPTTTGNWAIAFGGHHMAFNLTWHAGVGYPTPNHLGVEPKAAFTINGQSFAPLTPEGDAFFSVFKSLSTADLASAYLGVSFSDVLIGPVEYQTGSTSAVQAKYPAGTNRVGVKVSSLTSDQQALVIAAIKQWVDDYDSSIADQLLSDYTSSSAFADTLLAWGGTQSAGVDPDVNGTYLRIDGPRLWLELSCQAGVVIANISHFHTIYRDKMFDYAGDF